MNSWCERVIRKEFQRDWRTHAHRLRGPAGLLTACSRPFYNKGVDDAPICRDQGRICDSRSEMIGRKGEEGEFEV